MSGVGRRELLAGLALAGLGLTPLAALRVVAAPAAAEQRRLDNRLALWTGFARQSSSLLARYASQRSSPLLREELSTAGSLAFVAPGTLVLRDDGATGSTTRIEPGAITIEPNDPSLPRRELAPPQQGPALRWLADRLLACFAPGDGSALLADARVQVPRGRRPTLSLLPPRRSPARALIRSLTLGLDPSGGAILSLVIAEADGGSFRLELSDHRQGVDADALARVIDAN